MPDALGFDCSIPTSLLFVQTTEQQIDLLLQKTLGMIGFLQTGNTLVMMQGAGRHKFLARKDMPTLP